MFLGPGSVPLIELQDLAATQDPLNRVRPTLGTAHHQLPDRAPSLRLANVPKMDLLGRVSKPLPPKRSFRLYSNVFRRTIPVDLNLSMPPYS